MKNVMTFLLAAVLLIGAAPATQAQKNKVLTTKEANQVLQRIVGNWQVSHYVKQYDFEKEKLIETKGSANISRALQADYVHEQFDIKQPGDSSILDEGFLRYSEAEHQFEYVQLDKRGKSITLMVGKWSPEYNTLLFRPVKGDGQWDRRIDPNLQCLYLFKPDGTFIKLIRTFDRDGNFRTVSQYHFSYPGVAKL